VKLDLFSRLTARAREIALREGALWVLELLSFRSYESEAWPVSVAGLLWVWSYSVSILVLYLIQEKVLEVGLWAAMRVGVRRREAAVVIAGNLGCGQCGIPRR
jgi:hypothetical protein